MFTGLIEGVGTVDTLSKVPNGAHLAILSPLADELSLGDSIAVNGACLTAAGLSPNRVVFHLLHQTMRLTNLGELAPGHRVNLERPLVLGARLDGHLVSGHVDTTAPIIQATRTNDDFVLTITLPPAQQSLVIDKGSITVNGVSLTVASLQNDRFSVHLIPHTLQATNLGDLNPGAPVNLEMDMVGKFVLRAQSLIPG